MIKFNSDTNYPELVLDSTGLWSNKIVIPSDASHKCWVFRVPTLLSNLATNWKFLRLPLRVQKFAKMAHRTQEIAYYYLFIIKDTTQMKEYRAM